MSDLRYGTVEINVTLTNGHETITTRHFCLQDLLYEELDFMEQLVELKLKEIKEHRDGFHRELMKKAEADLDNA